MRSLGLLATEIENFSLWIVERH